MIHSTGRKADLLDELLGVVGGFDLTHALAAPGAVAEVFDVVGDEVARHRRPSC